ncbi:hypothetical protein BTUL_0162g00080 [Botrytis tulipae]|uniref:C2H2-type domain-containing protein n=1 Tax=Botrytis tulipae TaxID=87230 RepID=A0A4Z1EJK5_9HELO|nr:hypothetical protein BTUL_0162g00080 [Botrytis tulipae]
MASVTLSHRLIDHRLNIPFLIDPSSGTFRAVPSIFDEQLQTLAGLEQHGTVSNFQPEVPWDHGQYSEQHTSAQQSPVDPSFWVQQLSSTEYGLSSCIGSIDKQAVPILIAKYISRLFREQAYLTKQTSNKLLPGCKIPGFKKLSDLRRHQRSHEAPRFFCRVRTCKAYTRGFKRKDNLTQHRRRVHEANARASVAASHDSKPSARAEPIEDEEMGNASPPLALVAIKDSFDSNLSPKEFLLAKLAELQAMRMKLTEEKDEEIRAVEKTLSLM